MEFQGGGNAGRTIYVKYDKGNFSSLKAVFYSSLVRAVIEINGEKIAGVMPYTVLEVYSSQEGAKAEMIGYTLDLDTIVKIYQGTQIIIDNTLEVTLNQDGVNLDELTLITKEQFYDLTTEI